MDYPPNQAAAGAAAGATAGYYGAQMQQNLASDTTIRWDGPGYIKTLDGMLKVGAMAAALLGCICSGVSLNTAEGFYEFHGTTGLICTGILLLLYLFRIVYRIKIAWYLVEAVYCGVLAFVHHRDDLHVRRAGLSRWLIRRLDRRWYFRHSCGRVLRLRRLPQVYGVEIGRFRPRPIQTNPHSG